MDARPLPSVSHFYDANEVEFIRSYEEGGMGRIDRLVLACEATYRLTEIALLKPMQTEARLVTQKDGILVFVHRFGEKYDEERHEPLIALRALVELDLHA